MTADYAFGYALEKDTGDVVKAKGGKVWVGPHSPELVGLLVVLLQAQSSKAKIIGLANAGLDTTIRSSRRRNSASSRAARSLPDCC